MFNVSASAACRPAPYIENFSDQVEKVTAHGDTALYDAVSCVAGVLEEWSPVWRAVPGSEDYPSFRVVVLSYGHKTKLSTAPQKLAHELQMAGIFPDAVHVGSNDMQNSLHGIAKSARSDVCEAKSLR